MRTKHEEEKDGLEKERQALETEKETLNAAARQGTAQVAAKEAELEERERVSGAME